MSTALMNLSTQCGSWHKLADKYYRRVETYRMMWSGVDLGRSVAYAAPNGGPIAVLRDESKIQLINDHARPLIKIFTASGKLLTAIVWDKGRNVGTSWIDRDRLVCVNEAGGVFVYDVHGKLVSSLSLASELPSGDHVFQCRFWPAGVVALTTSCSLICATEFESPRPDVYRLGDTGLTTLPLAWLALPAADPVLGAVPTVLLATDAGGVVCVDGSGAPRSVDAATGGPYSLMCASPKGTALACFSAATGKLTVSSADFGATLVEFDTGSQVPPEQMAWCGGASVVLYWDKIMLVVGPGGDFIKYAYDVPPYMFSEVDGLRIVTNETSEFLECVPGPTEQIFNIGSIAPGAMLFSALEDFESKSPKADEKIRELRDQLPAAVDTCVEAAAHEFNHASQRALLRAAAFGKSFDESYQSDKFVGMCRALRVLNAVRNFEVGFPVTYGQYQVLKLDGLIDRLVVHHHHLLALRICKYMRVPMQRVVMEWACEKVRSPGDEMAISEQIFEMLKDTPGISYAYIASAAHQAKRTDLATRLLDHEPKAADQVPLLLEMGRDEVALAKAVECGDTDLMYLVLLRLRESRPNDFFEIFRAWPVAVELFANLCKQSDREMAKRVYKTLNQTAELAGEFVWDAYQRTDYEGLVEDLRRAADTYSRDKETAFEARMTEEQLRLHVLQMEFEEQSRERFFGLTLTETVLKLLGMGAEKQAARIRSDFKLTDRMYWHLRLKAIRQQHDPVAKFVALERLAREKKSPVGWEPFADVGIEGGVPEEAAKYICKIEDVGSRAQYFVRIGRWRDAADAAFKGKRADVLQSLQNRCTTIDKSYIADRLAALQK
eukprot:m51a1_g4374 hypothetical protein (835) ;mRNA; r:320047-323273